MELSEPIPLAELLGPPMRRCKLCNVEKPTTAAYWPLMKGKLVGKQCLPCLSVQKVARRKAAARVVATNTSLASQELTVGDHLPDKDKARNQAIMQARAELVATPSGRSVTSKLEVALALKQGSTFLNTHASSALTRLQEWMEDPEHPHHLWAVQFIVERALPRKLYESLGETAAGVGGAVKERPTFIVNVLPAGAPVPPAGHLLSVRPVIDVAPTEERQDD